MPNGIGIRWAIAAILMIATGGARAEDLASWQRTQRDPLRDYWQKLYASFPALDPKHSSRAIPDILSLAVEHGNLVLRTPLPETSPPRPANVEDDPNSGCFRTKVDGWDGWAPIRVIGGATKGQGSVIPQDFEFGMTDFLTNRVLSLSLRKMKDKTVLKWEAVDPQDDVRAELAQYDKDGDFTHPHLCTLTIITSYIAPTVFAEADFATLLHKHPDEMRRYLRPMLHRLDADFLLAVEPPVAWQVFPNAWQPDPKAADAVNKLLPQLAGGTFRQRTDARKALEALGTPGALEILHLDRTKLSLEQNAQLDRVVAPYRQLSDAQVKELPTDVLFLVDCLYCSDTAIRKAAIEELRKITRLDLKFDPAVEEPARIAAVADIREKLVSGKFLAALP